MELKELEEYVTWSCACLLEISSDSRLTATIELTLRKWTKTPNFEYNKNDYNIEIRRMIALLTASKSSPENLGMCGCPTRLASVDPRRGAAISVSETGTPPAPHLTILRGTLITPWPVFSTSTLQPLKP